jgi:hypothetical protein
MENYPIGLAIGVILSLLYQGWMIGKLRQRVGELENKVRIELWSLRITEKARKAHDERSRN